MARTKKNNKKITHKINIIHNKKIHKNKTRKYNLSNQNEKHLFNIKTQKGGEFSFFNNTLVYSLKKGSAIMFPSNFLYPHSVLPVINGTRYSIVTWFI